MTESFDVTDQKPADGTTPHIAEKVRQPAPRTVASNPVYARVGDTILLAARDGVQRNLTAKDIVREIREEHDVHLTIGEMRLLLASRRVPETPKV